MEELSRAVKYQRRHKQNTAVRWLVCIVFVLLLFLFVFFVWFAPMTVKDGAMTPSIREGDIVFYSRITKHLRLVERSDMIVIKQDDGTNAVRRVIATAGDKVEIIDGVVFINGKYRLDEHEYSVTVPFSMKQVEVPVNYVFALPDNREQAATALNQEAEMVNMDDIFGVVKFNLNEFVLYS